MGLKNGEKTRREGKLGKKGWGDLKKKIPQKGWGLKIGVGAQNVFPPCFLME